MSGPRTPKGKAASAMNAVRHGLRSSSPVIRGVEDPKEWASFRAAIVADLAPVGPVEEHLAERVALGFWRQRRCVRAETAAGAQLVDAVRADMEQRADLAEAREAARPDLEAQRLAVLSREADAAPWTMPRLADTPEVRRFGQLSVTVDAALANAAPVLAMGDLSAAELRVRYETAASKFARDALADLMARQGVRLAKSP